MARAASPLSLTPLGVATNVSGLSPDSARTLLRVLNDLPGDSMPDGDLAFRLLEGLASTPELANDRLRKRLTGSGRYPVAPSDVAVLVNRWMSGWEVQDLFLELPYVKRSRRQDSLEEWAQGTSPTSGWYDEFDKFAEFVAGAMCSFLPWISRASSQLESLLDDPPDIDWHLFAEFLELGANSTWAVAAIRDNVPVSRRFLGKVGTQLAERFSGANDPLGLVAMKSSGRSAVDATVSGALEANGTDDDDEMSRGQLLEWLSSRAGIPV